MKRNGWSAEHCLGRVGCDIVLAHAMMFLVTRVGSEALCSWQNDSVLVFRRHGVNALGAKKLGGSAYIIQSPT